MYFPLYRDWMLWASVQSPPPPDHHNHVLQVFFVEDKAMPGWSVVLKKKTRSRRINSTEDEHGLGQDGGRDDMQVFTNMDLQGGHRRYCRRRSSSAPKQWKETELERSQLSWSSGEQQVPFPGGAVPDAVCPRSEQVMRHYCPHGMRYPKPLRCKAPWVQRQHAQVSSLLLHPSANTINSCTRDIGMPGGMPMGSGSACV